MSLLFDTIDDVQDVVAISSDLPLDDLKPYLLACQRFVTRFTGEALIERLTTKLDGVDLETPPDPLSQVEKDLLSRLRIPIANLALIRYANVRNVSVTNVGVQRNHTSSSSDVFEWQINRLAVQLQLDAWEGLEELHRYLEVKRDDFSEYTDSAAFKADQKSLIRSAALFSEYYFINESRLTFYSLQPAMRKAQESRLKPILGDKLAVLLGSAQLTEQREEMLSAARTALVHATMARAIRERIVEVGPKGVQVEAVTSFMTMNYQQPADQKSIERAIAFHEKEASDALSDLSKLVSPPLSSSGSTTSGVRGGNGLIGF